MPSRRTRLAAPEFSAPRHRVGSTLDPAVGGTLEVGVVMDDPHTIGLVATTARRRRSLGRHTSADGAAGVMASNDGRGRTGRRGRPAAALGTAC
ncbi:hypothetical protein J421_1557 [Gemmatirosa kalamazoonensis]|uniref:Uncharacterized protein n=1 Tax=Gemmatirosa kalamazoonensis TaxID=861299 RepID=W0RD96_9BACT|nr:hypothetical protein [Gemmatirosa kalamazoonensis]AHG89094.1 hypothetical protein J421_1557 [Gemmatirosa kalamazoonensis]